MGNTQLSRCVAVHAQLGCRGRVRRLLATVVNSQANLRREYRMANIGQQVLDAPLSVLLTSLVVATFP